MCELVRLTDWFGKKHGSINRLIDWLGSIFVHSSDRSMDWWIDWFGVHHSSIWMIGQMIDWLIEYMVRLFCRWCYIYPTVDSSRRKLMKLASVCQLKHASTFGRASVFGNAWTWSASLTATYRPKCRNFSPLIPPTRHEPKNWNKKCQRFVSFIFHDCSPWERASLFSPEQPSRFSLAYFSSFSGTWLIDWFTKCFNS